MSIVEIENLRREFRGGRGIRKRGPVVVALEDVSLNIEQGEILGLLGPNGAGKTTLVKILSTVLLPTSGRARIQGYDVAEAADAVRPLIGIVFGGERGLYSRLTPRQNLAYWSALYKVEPSIAKRRVEDLLDRVGLTERADTPVETFSRGMKQRLHLARGLVSDPPVLFLDEPTTGMDPVAAREFRALVSALRSDGTTILLTTHDMAEAEAVCDRVALIDRGKLLNVESPRTLGSWIAAYERIDVQGASADLLDRIRSLDGVAEVLEIPPTGARIHVTSVDGTRAALEELVGAGVVSVRTSSPSLEEVYLHVFGQRGMDV